MTLRNVKISELTALTSNAEFTSWKHIPISPARALSQSSNPNAQPEDIALTIALDDETGEILAFAGAFPSKIQNAEATRFAWNSCWWVAEGEGGDAGMKVFISFLQAWDKKVAFSDMTEKTFKIIRNLGFCHTMKRDGIVLNIRTGIYSRTRALSYTKGKISFFAKAFLYSGIPILTELFTIILFYVPRRMQSQISDPLKPLKMLVPEEKDYEFIRKNSMDNFHIPESGELKMPGWLVKPTRQNKFLTKKYYFSSFAIEFSIFWLRWETEGKTNALAMLSLKDGVLKTLYVYCEESFRDNLSAAILGYCYANPAIRTLITAQPIITKYLSERKFFILSRKNFTRYSAISKDLMRFFDREPILQDGDGDYRFT